MDTDGSSKTEIFLIGYDTNRSMKTTEFHNAQN